MTLKELVKLDAEDISTRIYTLATKLVLLCLLYNPANTFADEDPYLRELEAEAKNTENLSNEQPKADAKSKPQSNSKNKKSRKQSKKRSNRNDSARLKANLKKFEQLLQFERPSTYRFYKRLELDQKQQVVENYNAHKKISESSKLIFDLYFKRK